MNEFDLNELGAYNAEVARGIVHTEEWKRRMALLQDRFDFEMYGARLVVCGSCQRSYKIFSRTHGHKVKFESMQCACGSESVISPDPLPKSGEQR